MLHELYAPQDTEAVAWSRQKKTVFLRLFSDMQKGVQPPRVILLYGPTGCGKLSAVQTLLCEQRDACGLPPLLQVLHTSEITHQQYYQFLMDTFTVHEGIDSSGWGSSTPMNSSDNLNTSNEINPNGKKKSQYQEGRVVVRVVKYYGEAPMSHLHTLTLRFLDHYDTWRRVYTAANTTNNSNSNSNNNSNSSSSYSTTIRNSNDTSTGMIGNLSLLRRHFVIFIATTHDTHSDKVALSKSFPTRVLLHPSLQTFHCTPITTRNMSTRIKEILKMEMRRRSLLFNLESFVSDEDIQFLCENSHGDIRHALLQLEWYLLGRKELRKDSKYLSSGYKPKQKKSKISQKVKNVIDILDEGESLSSMECMSESSLSIKVDADKNEGENISMIFRDEYLDVAHATARILSQKYTMSTVAEELNVEPEKLLGYLTNNMPAYFHSDQIQEYAACAAAASSADALRASGTFNKWRRAGGELHTNRVTNSDENEGAGAIGMDLLSLVLFTTSYVVYHKEVHTPHSFIAQRPPPYHPSAYPRLRELTRQVRKRLRNTWNDYYCYYDNSVDHTNYYDVFSKNKIGDSEGILAPELLSTEQSWRQDFLRRLQLHASDGSKLSGMEVDIIRESLPSLMNGCSALDTVLLEYLPYARHIVLDRPLRVIKKEKVMTSNTSSSSFVSTPTTTTITTTANTSISLPTKGFVKKTTFDMTGPKRTLFSFSKTEKREKPVKRICSLLRYNILCCGLPEKPPVRGDYFILATDNEDDEYDQVDDSRAGSANVNAFPNASPSMLPDGEDIEEYSD
ncbi:uncharacterized protein TM35_000073440 [Trypanosoma theileri]|uniref:Cell cycle checkpoint protein RAD17 n=1 Tax=Trypanosoma theileri TaxID=67003 RepID=A0A1X0P3C0_9TRYP|nr:uncharacterized protein TM35_000073440 [Trypanosoma theileri]ORC90920.1 hypothetical protein TM35_000073440 [Trypanosoma theileri]